MANLETYCADVRELTACPSHEFSLDWLARLSDWAKVCRAWRSNDAAAVESLLHTPVVVRGGDWSEIRTLRDAFALRAARGDVRIQYFIDVL